MKLFLTFLKSFVVIIILFVQINSGTAQTLSLTSTNISGGNFNIQASFSGNNSCTWDVTFTCPTCTPTSQSCSGVSSTTSCTVTFLMSPGSNPVSALATRTSGSGPQCGDNLPASTTVLPIVLKSFDVNIIQKNNVLWWITASETNNDYFTIERSADSRNFEVIGMIKGAGNSSKEINYEFTDEKPLSGINYYRIKQTDFDGQYSYSDVRFVRFNGTEDVIIYPKSTTGRLTIDTEMEDYNVQVFSLSGQEVQRYTSFYGVQDIDIQALKTGIYFIKVNNGSHSHTLKVVKI